MSSRYSSMDQFLFGNHAADWCRMWSHVLYSPPQRNSPEAPEPDYPGELDLGLELPAHVSKLPEPEPDDLDSLDLEPELLVPRSELSALKPEDLVVGLQPSSYFDWMSKVIESCLDCLDRIEVQLGFASCQRMRAEPMTMKIW